MILDKDTNPKQKGYFIGALILQEINASKMSSFDFFDLYEAVKAKNPVSMNLFSLSLDWLFLLELISHEKGSIKKCF